MLHSWSYHPSTLSCSLCLRLKKNKYTFGSVGVFHQQGPCTWSLPCLYEQDTLRAKHGGVFQLPASTKWRTWSTCINTLRRMLPTPHFELLGKRKTWVTPYQEVQMSRSTPNSNDTPREWTRWEVLLRRLKTLNPRRKVKSVVIHIYPFCIPFFLKFFTFLK